MAEENTATSSHLDSYMHVYDNGTTARLYVTPWDRNTVADGYWQTVNTIQPLINRDVYLADCIDKLSSRITKYNAGYAINISSNGDNTYTISVDNDEIINNFKKYIYDSDVFTENVSGRTSTIGIKVDNEYILSSPYGLYCNIDNIVSAEKNISSYSSVSAHKISAFTYEYTTAHGDFTFTSKLPTNFNTNIIYCVG